MTTADTTATQENKALLDWKKRISKEEKYETLSLLSPPTTVIIAGALSAMCLVTIFLGLNWVIILFIGKEIGKQLLNSLIGSVPYFVGLAIVGVIASQLECLKYKQHKKPFHSWFAWSWVYLFFSMLLLIITTYLVTIIVAKKPMFTTITEPTIWDNLGLQNTPDNIVWTILVVTAVVLSFTFANPLEYLWRIGYNFFLAKFTNVDYISVIEEKHFLNELKYRFDEARRYQVPLSLMVMKVTNYEELLNKIGQRMMRRIQNEVSEMLMRTIRHTDFIGILKAGQMRMILTYTPLRNTASVGERVKELVDQQMFSDKEGNEFALKVDFGVGCYTPEMREPEELLTRANYVFSQTTT